MKSLDGLTWNYPIIRSFEIIMKLFCFQHDYKYGILQIAVFQSFNISSCNYVLHSLVRCTKKSRVAGERWRVDERFVNIISSRCSQTC